MEYNDLSKAVTGEEFQDSTLLFDDTHYTPLEELIKCIEELPDKPVKVSNSVLSVNGKVINDSMEKYLCADGESSSSLKEILKTPQHYLWYKHQKQEPKPHFELGTFIHKAFLEPSKFSKVVIEPKINNTTNEGLIKSIQWYWRLLGVGNDCILTQYKHSQLREMLNELKANAKDFTIVSETHKSVIDCAHINYKTYGGGILPHLLKYIKSEVSMYGTDPQTGMKVKIRPDGLILAENLGVNIIVSMKTTSAGTIEEFQRDCAKFKYELSEGMYLDVASHITGREFTGTLAIMIQTSLPFQIALLWWDAEDLQIGKLKYYKAMQDVKECTEKGKYPGFDSRAEEGNYGIIKMKLPGYIKFGLSETSIDN